MSTEYETDEYGHLLCPLTDAEMRYDDTAEAYHRVVKDCRSPLYLNLAGSIPVVEPDDEAPSFDFNDSVTTAWTVECENGHVLLRSAGEEVAEPFKLSMLVEDAS